MKSADMPIRVLIVISFIEPKSRIVSYFASVGLRVCGSHGLGEIACEVARNLMLFAECYLWICDVRMGGSGDEVINDSHKCLHLTPVDGSSVLFFSLTVIANTSPACGLAKTPRSRRAEM